VRFLDVKIHDTKFNIAKMWQKTYRKIDIAKPRR
jgi:hypothetical protein